MLAVLVLAGTGAALTGFAPRASRRAADRRFLAVGLVVRLRLRRRPLRRRRRRRDRPAGWGRGRRRDRSAGAGAAPCCSLVAAPLAAVALLALVDLVSGGDAHLTRSVLDAGGLDELAEVAQRRLQLSAHSFATADRLRLPAAAGGGCGARAIAWRDRIASWLAGRPAMRAGPRRRPGGDRWAPSPTTPAPSCSRSAPPICSSSPASSGPRRATQPGRYRLVLRAHRACLAIFLDLSGRRESARGGACRGVPRPRPPRACARTLRPARPPQPGARTAPRRKRARRPTT